MPISSTWSPPPVPDDSWTDEEVALWNYSAAIMGWEDYVSTLEYNAANPGGQKPVPPKPVRPPVPPRPVWPDPPSPALDPWS